MRGSHFRPEEFETLWEFFIPELENIPTCNNVLMMGGQGIFLRDEFEVKKNHQHMPRHIQHLGWPAH